MDNSYNRRKRRILGKSQDTPYPDIGIGGNYQVYIIRPEQIKKFEKLAIEEGGRQIKDGGTCKECVALRRKETMSEVIKLIEGMEKEFGEDTFYSGTKNNELYHKGRREALEEIKTRLSKLEVK